MDNASEPVQDLDPSLDITIYGLDVFAPYLMNRILRRYNAEVDASVSRGLMTIPRIRVLAALAARGTLTINELSVLAVAKQSSTSRLVDQLVEIGWLARVVSEKDSRIRQVSLTQDGRAVFETVWPVMLAAQEDMLGSLDANERASFTASLRKILQATRRNDV